MHDGSSAPTPTPDTNTRHPDPQPPTSARPAEPANDVISGSLWRLPAMRLLALYTLAGFTGFFATIAALPAWVAATGVSDTLVGFVTTTLLVATVSTQSIVPRLVARAGMTATLAIGLAALGAPSLLLLIDGGYWWVLAICALRGIGFGAMTVLGAMLTARIVPAARRGEAIGIYGLAIAVPNLLAVPGGVALVSAGHFWAVALLGAAPLLGLPTVRALARAARARVDRTAPSRGPSPDMAPAAARASRRAARRAALGPAVVLMVVTLTSGGFLTYLPIVRPDGALATLALLTWGGTGAFTRWRAGVIADRSGLRILLPSASVLSIVGICVVAGGLLWGGPADAAADTVASWLTILVGSAILGMGFGGTQNLTLLAAFMQARQRETATVSSVWNIGFDTGTAIGSGLVGVMVLAMTIPAALALTSVLIVASLPLAVRGARPPLPEP